MFEDISNSLPKDLKPLHYFYDVSMAMDNLDFSALRRAVVKRVYDMPELLDNEIEK